MMRSMLLYVTIALMVSSITCADDLGYSYMITPSNDDNNSCLLNLSYAIENKSITFYVQKLIADPSNPSCTHQDLNFAPIFNGNPATGKIELTASATDPNLLSGVFTWDQFREQNGVSCVYMTDRNNKSTVWQRSNTCRFKFAGIYLYMNVYIALTQNITFDTTWTDLLHPEWSTSIKVQRDNAYVYIANKTAPNIIGMLANQCGWSGSNTITDMNGNIFITGSNAMSNTFDLNTILANFRLHDIYIRQNSANATDYRVYVASYYENGTKIFENAGSNGCTDTGIPYSAILQDATFCADGCAMSFLFFDDEDPQNEFILRTNGVKFTTPHLRA